MDLLVAPVGRALCSGPAHPAIRETIEHNGYIAAALSRRLEVAELAFELGAEGAAANVGQPQHARNIVMR